MPTLLPIHALRPSPSNPRRTYSAAGLDELAASIQANGILQPLCVRPLPADPFGPADPAAVNGPTHELVFGHRRLQAAQRAGLTHVPCEVVHMSDAEVLQAQVAENLEREDLHPLEEAEGFEALMRATGISADALAQQTGKSRSYIYGRLKLCKLCPEARQHYVDGRFADEIALMIARLPTAKMQIQALTVVKEQAYHFGRGYRSVRAELLDRFTLGLDDAIFDPADHALVPDAGACTTCPKLAGNAPEYFDSVRQGWTESDDHRLRSVPARTCTDPDCFAAKKTAHLRLQARKLEDDGHVVLTGPKAKAALDAHGRPRGDFAALDAPGVAQTLKQARLRAQRDARIAPPQVLTVQDPRSGKTVQVVRLSQLGKAGGAAGASKAKLASPSIKPAARPSAEQFEAARREADILNDQRTALFNRTLDAAATQPRNGDCLRLIVDAMLDLAGDRWMPDEWSMLARRHQRQRLSDVRDDLAAMAPDDLALLALGIALACNPVLVSAQDLFADHVAPPPDALMTAARRYGLVPEAILAAQPEPAAAPVPLRPAAQAQPGQPDPDPEASDQAPPGPGGQADDEADDDDEAEGQTDDRPGQGPADHGQDEELCDLEDAAGQEGGAA